MWTWSLASAPSPPSRAGLNLQTTGALTLGPFASNTTYIPSEVQVLFHCFAGINRSTATAFAFLMQECNIPLRVLVGKLCQVRPGQEYWRDRDQFLLALLRLDQDLCQSTGYQIRFL